MRPSPPLRFSIAHTWDAQPLPMEAMVHLRLGPAEAHEGGAECFVVEVDAPRHGDEPPLAPPGSTPRLWEHEVVEVFFLGEGEHYLEVELGPHGHFLVLELRGVSQVVRQGMDLPYAVGEGLWPGRWQGRAVLPRSWLPAGPLRLNAHAIHGTGATRRYLSWAPAGGAQPDFHRLDAFVPVELPL